MENIDADEEIILTGSPEVDINILVNLDIKSLNKFCLTSQYAQELCSDDYFWRKKFEHDGLPLEGILIIPTTTNDWIKEYNLTQEAQLIVANIMVVNAIEKTRSANKTKGIIAVNIQEHNMFFDILPNVFHQSILNLIGEKNYYFWVFLHHIDDNSYTILIYTYEYLQSPLLVSHRVELTKQWDYKETLRFLTAAQRYIKPGTQIKINDEAAYPLKIDQNWLDNLEQTKPQLYNAHMKFLIKRVAIWDTLEYLEPK